MSLLGQWLGPNWTPAASTVIPAIVGTNGELSGGSNTADIDTAGPGSLCLGITLDGSNDQCALVTGNASITRNKTILFVCGWFKANGTSGSKIMFRSQTPTSQARFDVSLQSTGFIRVGGRAGNAEGFQSKTTNSEYDDNTWHHVAGLISFATDAITIYVDGSSVAATGTPSFTGTATADDDSNLINLGGATLDYFPGSIADWRVYDSDESANLASIMAEVEVSTVVDPLAPMIPGNAFDPLNSGPIQY